MSSNKLEISQIIHNYRREKKLSLKDFGYELGVSRNTIYNWENGKVYNYNKVINKISDVFPDFNPTGLSTDLDFSKKGGHMVRTKDGYFLYLDVAGRLCRVSEENSDIVEVNLKGEWVPAKAP